MSPGHGLRFGLVNPELFELFHSYYVCFDLLEIIINSQIPQNQVVK